MSGTRPQNMPQGYYGEEMARYYHAENPSTLVLRSIPDAPFAITRMRYDKPGHGMNDAPLPREDAFVFCLQLREISDFRFWSDGKPTSARHLPAGSLTMTNMNVPHEIYLGSPFDSLAFYLNRPVLDQLSEDAQAARIDAFSCPVGESTEDPVARSLGEALLPVLERPHEANSLFVDHVSWALRYHLAYRYGGLLETDRMRGGLTPKQLQRSKQLLSAHPDGALSLETLARECGLSRSHFARAFRKSTGLPPHRWLLSHRLERAKDMLRGSRAPISEVASACGFVDASHLTRIFTTRVGATPGAYRRALRA